VLPFVRSHLLVVSQTLAIYFFLIIGLRILGRRQMGQLTVFDLVILIVLGSAVETAMIAGDTSLTAGLVSAAALLAANRLLSHFGLRSRRLRRLLGGGPVLLIHNGRFVQENLRKLGLTEEEVRAGIRERECADVADVRYAVQEADGEITVVPIDASVLEGNPQGMTRPDRESVE
jgi:uncharacterized membrane protein YcaP (DUF421 family)